MIANRELGMEDYLAIARRRITLVAVPALVAPLLGFLVSFALTPKYTSRSLLLVEGQVVPTGYVKPIVTERVSDRMTTLQQNVLSRSRLQPLVARLGLVRKGKSADAVIDQIRNNVNVTEAELGKSSESPTAPYEKKGPGGTADVSGFHVSYSTDNPRDAQQVCAEITSMILAENLEVREQVARSTTEFLSRQLDQAKHNLDDMDAKLAQFKIQHFGRMPGDMEANFRILAIMNSQIDASTQNISRLQQEKTHTETILEQQLEAWKTAQAAPTYPTLRQQLLRLQNELVVLQIRYTDDFPDVIKTKHQIEQLQAKLKEINTEADSSDALQEATVPRGGTKLEPPQIMALREQIYRNDKAIDHATEAQKKLEQRIDTFQSRFSADPEIEEEWKQLTRDTSTAHGIYNELLTNKSTAEISTEMEHNQEGEQLKLLDPASLPGAPSFPVRGMFALYGLAAGLGVGVSIALWLELQDKAIRNEGDVLAALELPMLGSVPWVGLESHGKGWRNKLRRSPQLEQTGTGLQ
jgi:protein tyrosine kinase modulator